MRFVRVRDSFTWVSASILSTVLGLTLSSAVAGAALTCEGAFASRSSFVARVERIGMTRDLLARTHRLALDTVKRYPPEKFYLVNVGPSTTLLSSFIRKIAPREKYLAEIPVLNSGSITRLSAADRSVWMKRILPGLSDLGGREVVVNRVLWMGGQMSTFAPMFHEYIRDNGFAPRTHFNMVIGYAGEFGHFPVKNKTSMMAWTELATGNSEWHYTVDIPLASASVFDRNHRMRRGARDFHEMSSMKVFNPGDPLTPGFTQTPNPDAKILDKLVSEFLHHKVPGS